MEIVYTHGSCWQFHKILKSIFPEAEPFYTLGWPDQSTAHVITKIGGKFYDITGEVEDVARALPMTEENYPNVTVWREGWWCKLTTLVDLYDSAKWNAEFARREKDADKAFRASKKA